MAEGARLESVYTARYPGFESLSLRQPAIFVQTIFEKSEGQSSSGIILCAALLSTIGLHKGSPRFVNPGIETCRLVCHRKIPWLLQPKFD